VNLLIRVPFYILLIFSLSVVAGCKSENKNPEALDPIYKDLVKEHKSLVSQIKDLNKRIEGLKKEVTASEARSAKRMSSQLDLKRANQLLIQLNQKEKYLSIRKERRRVEGRRAYRIAFKKGETWPDPKEYKDYQLTKKLQTTTRNWDARVPKLHQNSPNYNETEKKDSE